MLARIARAAAVTALAAAILVLGFCSLAVAVHLTAAPAPAPAATATFPPQTHTPGPTCWVEHHSDADGGPEKVCGDPALMPAGSTPILLAA